MNTAASEPLLKVRELKKGFPVTKGIFRRQVGLVKAVDGVSFDLLPGETISLVGESGCGKTTTGRAILQLIEPNSGEVEFRGKDLTKLNATELREMRRHMQIIFQDPFSSLNPRQTVGEIIGGPMILHGICDAGEVDDNPKVQVQVTNAIAPATRRAPLRADSLTAPGLLTARRAPDRDGGDGGKGVSDASIERGGSG